MKRTEVNEVICTWEDVLDLPENHVTHPEFVTREQLAHVLRMGFETLNLAEARELLATQAIEDLRQARGGRPEGRKKKVWSRRTDTRKSGYYYLPQELLFNTTLKHIDLRVWGLVKVLSESPANKNDKWTYATQRQMIGMIEPNPSKSAYRKIGHSLRLSLIHI